MKHMKLLFGTALILSLASGCVVKPRFGPIQTICKPASSEAKKITMAVPQAEKILKDAIMNPPAGRRRAAVDFNFIRQYVTAVQIRQHSKTRYYLVEFMTGKRKYITFYVDNRDVARKVAEAVWCLSAKKSK